jgi:hypothetical protein
MKHLGTLFNINYLNRGLALLESLKHHETLFKLYVLCLDDETFDYLSKEEPNFVVPIKLTEIEAFFPELNKAKSNRSMVEYFFTLSPALPLYILKKYTIPQITTLDADIYVYNSLDPIFDEMGSNSILISPHKFSDNLKHKEIYGFYNVSFQSFKNDVIGLSCLEDWLKNCTEWCYDKLEDGKFADQLYLNSWIEKYKKVSVIQHDGAAIAPWNLGKYTLKTHNDKLYVDDKPLLFYHFHGVKFVAENIVLHNLNEYNTEPTNVVIDNLYGPYINKLSYYSSKTSIAHQNIRYNYSKLWIFKKILKGGALKINKNNTKLMNKQLSKLFARLSSFFSKRS